MEQTPVTPEEIERLAEAFVQLKFPEQSGTSWTRIDQKAGFIAGAKKVLDILKISDTPSTLSKNRFDL